MHHDKQYKRDERNEHTHGERKTRTDVEPYSIERDPCREQAIDQFAFGDLQITAFLDPGPLGSDLLMRTVGCSSLIRETVKSVVPMVIIELTEHCGYMPRNGPRWSELIHEPVHEDLHAIVPTNGDVLDDVPEAIIGKYLHTTGSMCRW